MQKKIYLFSFATVLWLALSAFYGGPIEDASRMGLASSSDLSEFYSSPPPPCVGPSTDSGDFPVGQMTQWVVPDGVTEVTVIAIGGDGSNGGLSGGSGAIAQGSIPVSSGDVLNIIVAGTAGQYGGGGGTGIYNVTTDEVLIVAGGGGASGLFAYNGQGGRSSESGGDTNGPMGGTNGSGGEQGAASGGGGAFSPGGSHFNAGGGQGVPNGGNGGVYNSSSGAFGFGGGGAGFPTGDGGGGGGYSGGGSAGTGSQEAGGGGGSYVHPSGTNVAISEGVNGGGNNQPGAVTICYTLPLCPPGDVSLETQADVNAFVAAYPNCTEIAGNLMLGNNTVSPDFVNDISGLSAITSIAGDFQFGRTDLTSLNGLDNLLTIGGGILIAQNNLLVNIDALSNLNSVSDISIFGNSSLTNLNGFSGLNALAGLNLLYMPALTSLAGLENITSYGFLYAEGNFALNSLDGLNDAATFNYIGIFGNSMLETCSSPAICNHLLVGGSAEIAGNAAGCGSVAEVEAACFPCDIAIDNITPTAESCPGANDGSITVIVSCTTCSGIEYTIDGVNYQASNTFSGQAPGAYTVTVRDTGDPACEATDDTTVNGGPTTDSDGDGTEDCNDGCPSDPDKVAPGVCGCGVADTDSDGDGTADCIDECPNDPGKVVPGLCGCGTAETDTDSDGTPDCLDECPMDPNKYEAGICGCGVPETDCIDACAVFNALVDSVMEDDTELNNGQQNALITKLHHAKLNFEVGDNNTAINQLNAFINQVQGLSGGNNNPIPSSIADDWIAAAQSIIDNINTGTALCIQSLAAAPDQGTAFSLTPNAGSLPVTTGQEGTQEVGDANRSSDPGVVVPSLEPFQMEAFPNPFTRQVSLQYYLPQDGQVQLSILSIHGQVVAKVLDSRQFAGLQRVAWTAATSLPAGVYFARLQTESGVSTLQLVLVK